MIYRLSTLFHVTLLTLGLNAAACTPEASPPRSSPLAPAQRFAAFELQDVVAAQAEYRELAPDDRVALWQAQLDLHLATGVLTADERRWIERARTDLPRILAMGPDELADLETAAIEALGATRTRQLFATLGRPEVRRAYTSTDERTYYSKCDSHGECTDCECPWWSNWCFYYECHIQCENASYGCGWFWMQRCNTIEMESSYLEPYCRSSSAH